MFYTLVHTHTGKQYIRVSVQRSETDVDVFTYAYVHVYGLSKLTSAIFQRRRPSPGCAVVFF